VSGAAAPYRGTVPPPWLARLAERANAAGFLRFDRFMELALYDPEFGYYTRSREPFGRAGDFYTAAHVTPVFARTIAGHLRAVWGSLGRPRPFRVVELGPGDGTLAEELVRSLRGTLPADAVWEYEPREASAALRQRTVERVSAVASGPVRLAEAGAVEPFVGAFLGNEVLDALPARRLRFGGGTWREQGARVEEDRLVEAWSAADPLPAGVELPPDPVEGDWFEFAPATAGLLRDVADHLERGVALFLDYGTPEAPPPGQRSGSLASLRAHRSLEAPFSMPGDGDLSVFVPFGIVRAAARSAGLAEVAFGRQRERLGAWGYPSLDAEWRGETADPAESVRRGLASKQLLFGFEGFYALELAARTLPEGGSAAGS
jgi:SAM-dependent MidA family methyltransferase